MLRLRRSGKAQIALEFLIVYSFVLIIFILLFSIISSQRSATLGQQQYSLLQLQSQNVASYIDQAAQAGTGYSASVPLVSGVSHNNYNLSISSTGVVIASTQIATQPIVAYSFSHARSFVINGTLERSANGINIYQISTSKGSLSISNLKGTIYINQVPASITSLVQGAIVSQQANVKAAVFNDSQDSYIVVPNSNALTFGGSFTMSFWFYISAERQECGSILGKATAAQIAIDVAAPCTAGYYSNDILDFNYGSHSYASPSVPSDTWTHGVVVVDVTNAIMTWYLNGVKVAAYNGVASIPQDAQTLYIGNGDATFNGSVANLQIYNSILNGNQISSLYLSGMGGPPVNSTLAGWWPLNGNPNDYSGYGDQGIPTNNPKYTSVIQLAAHVYSVSGNSIANTIVGFTSSRGYINSNGLSSYAYTNSNGVASAFVTAANSEGYGNVSADIFNGNVTTIGNLIAWWPLDSGYGTNVPDLSPYHNSGSFDGTWKPSVNQTNFAAASFPGDLGGVVSSAVQDGFVTISSSQSLLGIVSNKSFTAIAWIYYKGPTPNHNQGILGNWPGGVNEGFQLEGYCESCANNGVLYVNGNYVSFPNGLQSFPANTWEMVTIQYNGNTGAAKVYLNSTVFASNTIAKNLPLLQTGNYLIGGDASQTSGLDTFNGLITNLQLYDTYLNQQQISSIYQSGLASSPVGNGGLVAWLPLLNSTIDYSSNGNNGVAHYNVSYVNSAYNNSALGGTRYATFNGFANAVVPYSSSLSATGSFSVSFWFSSFQSSSSTFNGDMIDTLLPGSPTFDVELCGNKGCGVTGLNGTIGTGSSTLGIVTYPFTFSKNTWYAVTETFNTTAWTVYLNGNKVNNGTYSGTPSFLGSGNHVTIGGDTPGVGDFVGQLADVQVYNSKLTAQQVQQLYIQGLPSQNRLNISIG